MTDKKNYLLEALPEADRQALARHLKRVAAKQHDVLFEIRDLIEEVYFPLDAVVSLVIPLSTGEIVETAMVGRDGVVGGAAALNGRTSQSRAIVQVGGEFLRCAVGPLRELVMKHTDLRWLLGAHEQALFAQAQQSAACNGTHVIESRLCRWLLRAADLHDSEDLPLTQEYIAQMLGVRRTTVTTVASMLQRSGMISYSRGHIKLLDLPALQDTACECYETVKANYKDLLHPEEAKPASGTAARSRIAAAPLTPATPRQASPGTSPAPPPAPRSARARADAATTPCGPAGATTKN